MRSIQTAMRDRPINRGANASVRVERKGLEFVQHRNFIIVGTQRIGSSAIGELIGQHPDCVYGGEWTQWGNPFNKIGIAEMALAGDFSRLNDRYRIPMERDFGPTHRWLGFKRLFRSSNKWWIHPSLSPALWVDRFEAHLQWFKSRPDIHFLHIVRRNNLEWIKSKKLREITGTPRGQMYPDDAKISVSLSEAIARIRSKHWVDSRLAILQSSCPYLRVDYEDFLSEKFATMRRIMEFIDCDPALLPMSGDSVIPQSKGDASRYLENFAELETGLRVTELSESLI